MESIIKELWHGKIIPEDAGRKSSPETKKLTENMGRYYSELLNSMTDEQKVILEKFDKQTLMSKLGASYYGKFSLIDITDAYNSGKLFAPTEDDNVILNPVSGATKSANAGCNAVNCVIKYVGVNA